MLFLGYKGTVKTDGSIAEQAWRSEYKWIKWLVMYLIMCRLSWQYIVSCAYPSFYYMCIVQEYHVVSCCIIPEIIVTQLPYCDASC